MPRYYHILLTTMCIVREVLQRYNIQTNNTNTKTIFCRTYSVQSPRSTIMADGFASNPRPAFGEYEECSRQRMKDRIGYLSQRLTIIDATRFTSVWKNKCGD